MRCNTFVILSIAALPPMRAIAPCADYNDTQEYLAPDLLPVMDQGKCGACYAFAAAQVYGSRLKQFAPQAVANGIPSAEWLLSCMKNFGGGCNGGFSIAAFQYMHQVGIATNTCAPFTFSNGIPTGKNIWCPLVDNDETDDGAAAAYDDDNTMAYSSGGGCNSLPPYKSPVPSGDQAMCVDGSQQDLLQPMQTGNCFTFNHAGWTPYTQYDVRREIKIAGPVAATILICEQFYEFYHNASNAKKIYTQNCSVTSSNFVGYHEVVIVGWGTINNIPYWRIKNSWGQDWGDKGYFNIKRGDSTSGIESSVCTISPETYKWLTKFNDGPRGHAVFTGQLKMGQARGQWNLAACNVGGNNTGDVWGATGQSCCLGAVRKAGEYIPRTYHDELHKAANFALNASGSQATMDTLHNAQSQVVKGANMRVLFNCTNGTLHDATIYRNPKGKLQTSQHNQIVCSRGSACTAPHRCCGATNCAECVSANMNAEIALDAPKAEDKNNSDKNNSDSATIIGLACAIPLAFLIGIASRRHERKPWGLRVHVR